MNGTILIIGYVIIIMILMVLSVYMIVYFQHPDDKNQAYFPKITVLLGMVIAGATIMLLPVDVANRAEYAGCTGYDMGPCGELNMIAIWDTMYWLIVIMLVVFIPLSTFFYEADDGSVTGAKNSRLKEALISEVFVILIVSAVFTGLYQGYGTTTIPVVEYRAPPLGDAPFYTALPSPTGNFTINQFQSMTQSDVDFALLIDKTQTNKIETMDVSVITFMACLICFIGWFLFALFCGIGISALPLDLVLAFFNKPHRLDAVEFVKMQKSLQKRVNTLVDIGELLKREREQDALNAGNNKKCFSLPSPSNMKKRNAKHTMFLEFKQAVHLLEIDTNEFHTCSDTYKKFNPLLPYVWLFFGILSFVLSIFWVLQCCLYVLPDTPVHPFLNQYLVMFDTIFPLFGVVTVAVFIMYLMLCTVKGCFKFGLRCFCFQLYPMQIDKTYMSAFLFNLSLILLCVLPCIQFSTAAFGSYTRYSNAAQMYGVEMMYIGFFQWFWETKFFYYAWITIVGLTALYLAIKPKEARHDGVALRDRLENVD